MRRMVTTLALIVLAFSCSEAEFGSENAPSSNDDGDGTPQDPVDPPDGPPKDGCVEGDAINLQFPPNIQSCIDDGNIYDFDRDKCTNVKRADWTCDWDTLIDEMSNIGTSSGKTKSGKADGNKLVSCGQSNAGDLIVAQWWDASRSDAGNCEFGKGKMLIVTGCYGDLPTNADTDNLTDEERQKIVSDCLKILSD